MIHDDPIVLLFLFLAGFSGGFVDSIAGGGGLITLPALIMTGMPPQLALGTNKFQGSFSSFSSATNYIRKGVISLDECFAGILFTFFGAVSGSFLVQQINADFIKHLIPFLLIPVALYSFLGGSFAAGSRKAMLPLNVFYFVAGVLLGFYDGFFGPGTGSFWAAGLVYFMGFELTKATGATKVMNFTSNITALTVFLIGGNIDYGIGMCMALGAALGARIGSTMAVRKGAGFIKPIFIVVVVVTMVSLFYQNYWQNV